MRKLLSKLLSPSILACAATVGLAAIANQAAAQSPPPTFMKLGGATPAPFGYLNFCARMPEECGLTDTRNPQGQPITVEQRARDLIAKYYWRVLFESGPTSNIGLTPTSGPPAQPSNGRYDWSSIFGVSQPASNAVQPLETNPTLMSELDRVNIRINQAVRYVSDRTLYGDEDYWHLPLESGGPAAGDCKDYALEKRRALIADGVPAADLSIAIVQTSWGEAHAVLLATTDRGELVLDSLNSLVKPWQDVRYRWLERQAPGQQLNWVKLS